MKGNNSLFNNNGNKKISRSKYLANKNEQVSTALYNNKLGAKLLKKAKSQETKNFIKQYYRSGAKFGDGSTAKAVIEEIKFGVKIGGKSHINKAEQGIKLINNILRKYPNHVDKKILISEKNKLEKALKTKPKKGK